MCFVLIFFIVLSSLAVAGTAKTKAVTGIDDLFITLYTLLAGGSAAAGASAVGVSDSFSSSSFDDAFSHRSPANEVYTVSERRSRHDTSYYQNVAVNQLLEYDAYYYDWSAVFESIRYYNEREKPNLDYLLSMKDESWIWNLVDGKFSVAQLVEMGLLKQVVTSDDKVQWVMNLIFKKSQEVEFLKILRDYIPSLVNSQSLVSDLTVRAEAYSDMYWSDFLNLTSSRDYALSIYRNVDGSLSCRFYYGLIKCTNYSNPATINGNRFYKFTLYGYCWYFTSSFFCTGARKFGRETFFYYPVDDKSLDYSTAEHFVLFHTSSGTFDFGDFSDPGTIPKDKANEYVSYLDNRIGELENNDDTVVVPYIPPIYDKDGTLVQEPGYVTPITDEVITDNAITDEGVVDNPVSGGTDTGNGILDWLKSLWDWLTGIFWDAIHAIQVAVSAIGDWLSSIWDWCKEFWASFCGTIESLFVPDPDYWDDKPDPGKVVLKRLTIINQVKRIVDSVQHMDSAPLTLSFDWFDIDTIFTYPNPHKTRTYTVDFSWYNQYKDYVRGGLSVLFIVLAVLGCVRIICGVFGVGLSNANSFNIGSGSGGTGKEIVLSDRGLRK